MINPLFAQDDDTQQPHKKDEEYILANRHGRKINPVSPELIAPHTAAGHKSEKGDNPAIELIRRKVEAIYDSEPNAKQELAIEATPQAPTGSHPHRTKHQQFMFDLSTSGKSLAHIQTEWHNYYVSLPDDEKHAVWQEFYAANNRASAYNNHIQAQSGSTQPLVPTLPSHLSYDQAPTTTLTHQTMVSHGTATGRIRKDRRGAKAIKKEIIRSVRSSGSKQAKAKQHFQSLLFGIGSGAIVLAIFFFGFFNEVIVAPFIQPSRQVSATPIIVDSDSVAPSTTPEVIIPKINVQIPTIYDVTSMDEHAIQEGLERGIVHYPITALPGQQGNVAVFGHSSNNIFNKGKYKFAFVKLRELVPGDLFYLTYDNKVYAYRVFDKKIVTPSEVSVLNPVAGKTATATLITCDPPGTSTNRLVVWGEQISPDPATASAATPTVTDNGTPSSLTSEGPTMWSRFWSWIF